MTDRFRDAIALTVAFVGGCALLAGFIMCGYKLDWFFAPLCAGIGMLSFSFCYWMARAGL